MLSRENTAERLDAALPSAPEDATSSPITEYPFEADLRLDSHYWFPWHFRAYRASSFYLMAPPEVRAIWFDLINISMDQTPVGTLPNNRNEIQRLANISDKDWVRIFEGQWSAFHGWEVCRVDDFLRLQHTDTLKRIADAIHQRDLRVRSQGKEAKRKRVSALKQTLRDMHAPPMVIEDGNHLRTIIDAMEKEFPPAEQNWTRSRVLTVCQTLSRMGALTYAKWDVPDT